MITEDYVSYEIAKLLKEKGFDERCEYCYAYFDDNDIRVFELRPNKNAQNLAENRYPYVTHQMAMKWLREKDVIIVIQPEYFNVESKCSAWGVDIWADDNYEKLQGDFPSYEEAVEAALKYSLENLI